MGMLLVGPDEWPLAANSTEKSGRPIGPSHLCETWDLMHARRLSWFLLALALLTSACQPETIAPSTPNITPVAVSAAVTRSAIGKAAIVARPLYAMNVTLNYAASSLRVQERVEFTNPSGQELNEIKFNVPPARHANAINISDARVFGAATPLSFTTESTILTVRLAKPLAITESIALALEYTLSLPRAEIFVGTIGGDDSGAGADSLVAGHWYVMLAPWRADGWETPGFYPVGDSYTSELADYDVTILAPDGVTVAGAGDEVRRGREWRYTLRGARVFAFAASDQYKLDVSTADGVQIITYTLPKHRVFAEDVMITAERSVTLFNKLYGRYPYKTLRVVETSRAQGQEYSGLIGLGSKLFEGYSGSGARHDLIASTTHEVSHQWWFQQVGNDQIHTPWLDEAFARMAEVRFYETYYAADVEWWMETYLRSKKPSGPIDGSLAAYPDATRYLNGVYRRGALFLLDVRKAMGDAAFDAALKDHYTATTEKIATPSGFFDALARHTQADIGPLVREYFAQPPALPCGISAGAAGCR